MRKQPLQAVVLMAAAMLGVVGSAKSQAQNDEIHQGAHDEINRGADAGTKEAVGTLPQESNSRAEARHRVEEIVVNGSLGRYSATKSDTPIMETARSLSIETRQDLLDQGALNLSDAYLYSAGVIGERYGFATRGDSVAVRGVTNLTLLAILQETDSDTAAQFHSVYGTHFPAPNGEYLDFDTYTGEPGFNRYDTQNNSLTLLADHELNSHWSLEATARYTKGESDYNQAWHAFIGGDRYVYNPDGSLYEGGSVPRTFYIAHNQSKQIAIDARARVRFMTGSLEHELLMGVMYQDVTTQSNSASLYALGYDLETGRPDGVLGDRFWINVFDPVYSGDVPDQSLIDSYYSVGPEAQTKNLGFYINDQITLGNLNILMGLRHDEVETDNSWLCWRH